MATVRTAGTEIIRTSHNVYTDATTTEIPLIYGVQYHIYTILSIICYGNTADCAITLFLKGYTADAGTTDTTIYLLRNELVGGENTFVWNDKFSFNGFEPVDFTGPMDDATKQDAIADQGSSVAQVLYAKKAANGDQFHIHTTFIDQNNS